MAKAMDVADYIIELAVKKGNPVSNLVLQKTMYFLNVISLLNDKNNPLIQDESFEKWAYGPVLDDVYHEYSSNGSDPINEIKEHKEIDFSKMPYQIVPVHYSPDKLNSKERKLIDDNLDKFINFDNPFDLVEYSHKEDQWNNKENTKYDNNLTIDYYKNNRFWESVND